MGCNDMKLHLGCGHKYLDGWVNVDGPKDDLCYDDLKADVHTKIEELDYPDNTIDEILMEAVFEHFPRHIAIMQLRKFYKWLKPSGKITILVPDFWGTVKMLKKSRSPQEKQFWFRHLFGPQDTLKFGTHYDAFDVDKLEWMFSVVGFNACSYEIIKRWPSIRFIGTKESVSKSDADAEDDIVMYMAYYESADDPGLAFSAWMGQIGINAKRPEMSTFRTQKMYTRPSILSLILSKIKGIVR